MYFLLLMYFYLFLGGKQRGDVRKRWRCSREYVWGEKLLLLLQHTHVFKGGNRQQGGSLFAPSG